MLNSRLCILLIPGCKKCTICSKKVVKKEKIGSILIEFAFSIPILITLMFFVLDHYRFFELREKVKTSAYLAASMLQQIGNTKINKQLTIHDVNRISYASCLNFFNTNTMFKPCPFGIRPGLRIYYVKRISDNEYRMQFCYANTEVTQNISEALNMSSMCGKIQTKTSGYIASIHTDLICNKNGDERVFIFYFYWPINFNKSKLGFLLLTPIPSYAPDGSKVENMLTGNFVYGLVITPKPGLFPVKDE